MKKELINVVYKLNSLLSKVDKREFNLLGNIQNKFNSLVVRF